MIFEDYTQKTSEPSVAADGSLLLIVKYIGNNLKHNTQDTKHIANIYLKHT